MTKVNGDLVPLVLTTCNELWIEDFTRRTAKEVVTRLSAEYSTLREQGKIPYAADGSEITSPGAYVTEVMHQVGSVRVFDKKGCQSAARYAQTALGREQFTTDFDSEVFVSLM